MNSQTGFGDGMRLKKISQVNLFLWPLCLQKYHSSSRLFRILHVVFLRSIAIASMGL